MEKDSNLGNEKWRDKEKITVVKNQAKNSSEIKPKIEYKLSPEDQSSLNEYNNILSALTLEDIVYKGDKASSIISHITLLFDNFVNNEIEGFKEKMRCVIEEHSEFESEYNEIKSLRNLIDFSFKISGKIISDNKDPNSANGNVIIKKRDTINSIAELDLNDIKINENQPVVDLEYT